MNEKLSYNKRNKGYMLIMTACLVFSLFFSHTAMYVQAEDGDKDDSDTSTYTYSSWVQGTDAYKEFYKNSDLTPKKEELSEAADEGFLLTTLGSAIHFIAKQVGSALVTTEMNLSIDGIIFGRMAQPVDRITGKQVCYTSFELTDGNPYGIIGATIYTILRGLTYSFLFIAFLYLLARAMFNSSPKAKEELKNGVYQILLSFVLIYLLPQVTDLVLFLRDELTYRMAIGLGTEGKSLLVVMEEMYEDAAYVTGRFSRGFLFAATVAANIIYLKDYVSVAIQQTLLFGFFCVFNLLGIRNKKLLSDWAALFFSNMLYPVLDIVTLLLPFMAIKALSGYGGSMTFNAALIVVFMVWTARSCRSQLLKLFGNMTGTPAGRGFGGLAQMVQMARMAHMMGRAPVFAGGASSEGNSYSEWKSEESNQAYIARDMSRQANEITQGLPDVNSELESRRGEQENSDDKLNQFVGGGETEETDAAQKNEQVNDAAESMIGELPEPMDGNESEDWDSASSPVSMAELEDLSEKLPPMGDFDKQRYENLRTIDELDSSISNLQAQNAEIDRQISAEKINNPDMIGPQIDKNALRTENADIDARLQAMESAKSAADTADKVKLSSLDREADATKITEIRQGMSDRQAKYDADANALKQQQADNNRLLTQSQGSRDERIAHLQAQKEENSRMIAANQKQLDTRKNAERQFVQVAKDHGKDAKQYASSQEMRHAMETRAVNQRNALEAAKKKAIFSKEDLRGFSPETSAEIARLQKEVVRTANARSAARSAAKKTAGVTAAVIGAAAMGSMVAYGGEEASIQGAMLGGMMGAGAAKKAGSMANSVYQHREEIADTIIEGAQKAQNVAKAHVPHGRRVFSRTGVRMSVSNSPVAERQPENLKKTEEYAYKEHANRPSARNDQ